MNSIERMINEAGKYKSATEFIESQIAVYHGSPRRFMVFHHKYLGSSNGLAPLSKMGFSFTDNIKVARSFGKYIKKVYVILNRPYLIDADGRDYSEFKHTINDKIEYLNKSKYDGIVIRNYRDAGIRSKKYILGDHYIPFNVNQIVTKRRLIDYYRKAKMLGK